MNRLSPPPTEVTPFERTGPSPAAPENGDGSAIAPGELEPAAAGKQHGRSDPGTTEEANRLRDAVDDASRYVVTRYTTFLLLSVYLAITIGTTTDEMLLRESRLELPLLGAELPIVPFYAVLPLLYFLLHLYMLMQLSLLSSKLLIFKKALQKMPEAEAAHYGPLVHPFSINHLVLRTEQRRVLRVLLYASAVMTFVVGPIILLGWVQRQFLPYHSEAMTWWHRGIVIADLVAIWLLWPGVLRPMKERPERPAGAEDGAFFRVWSVLRSVAKWSTAAVLSLLVLASTLFVLAVPGKPESMSMDRFFVREDKGGIRGPDWVRSLGAKVLSMPFLGAQRTEAEHVARIDAFFAAAEKLLHRNLVIRDRVLVAGGEYRGEASLDQVIGLNLRGRDLRFADFTESRLPKADFRPKMDLTDEELCSTTKVAAHEEQPEDGRTRVSRQADLRGAVFYRAELPQVRMILVRADRADFSGAITKGADLRRAELHRAYLYEAELHGADLQWAELHRAHLYEAELHGADLGEAQLHGADLVAAELHGADLVAAELHGAGLAEAVLHGADLTEAELHGADLTEAKLHGADLNAAKLHGADLSEAELHTADLRFSSIGGAVFSSAQMHLCDARDLRYDMLSEKAWDEIRAGIESGLAQSSRRETALQRIDLARVRETGFPPDDGGVNQCLLDAPMLHFETDYVAALGKLACNNEHVAQAFVNRVMTSFRVSQIRAGRGDRRRVVALARLLLDTSQSDACAGVRALPEKTLAELRAVVEAWNSLPGND